MLPDPLCIASWPAGQYLLKLWVTDSVDGKSYPRYIEVEALPQAGAASLPAQLAAAIVDPATITISNVNYRGVAAAATTFSGGLAAGLEMDEGVVLTTGLASSWNAGNNDPDITKEHPISCISMALAQQVGERTYALSRLEFEFQCAGGQLEIEYQIGSEEYVEWVTNFNDALHIQVDGRKISLTPDAAQTVAVNAVHRHISGWERRLNPDTDLQPAYEYLYFDNPHRAESDKIEYDGMIVKIKAHVFLTSNPLRSHRANLGIADTGDQEYDSALFVRKRGITSNTP